MRIVVQANRQHPERNGIVERIIGTVREESDKGNDSRQAEAIIAHVLLPS